MTVSTKLSFQSLKVDREVEIRLLVQIFLLCAAVCLFVGWLVVSVSLDATKLVLVSV